MQLAIPLQSFRASLGFDFDLDNQLWRSVPNAIAIALQFLTALPVCGATLKDLTYGSDYTGITAPAAYINECARRGVTLWSAGGTNTALLKVIRTQLGKLHPVLATVIDRNTDLTGITRPLLFYGLDEPEGTITALDPTTGSDITCTDTQWAALLRIPEIWIAQKRTLIPAGWRDNGDTLMAPNGMTVRGTFREYILESRNQWHPDNWPLETQQNARLDLFQRGERSGTCQCFRFCLLAQTPRRGVFMASIGEALLAFEQALQAVQHQTQTGT